MSSHGDVIRTIGSMRCVDFIVELKHIRICNMKHQVVRGSWAQICTGWNNLAKPGPIPLWPSPARVQQIMLWPGLGRWATARPVQTSGPGVLEIWSIL